MSPPSIKRFLNRLYFQVVFGKSKASAITEFLIFTLPFFVFLFFITTNVYQNSLATSEAKNLARQSLRAFITSPSNELAEVRANQVIDFYRNSLSVQNAAVREFEIKFTCTRNPCLSPGGTVIATLEVLIKGDQPRRIFGTAMEYVDLWR